MISHIFKFVAAALVLFSASAYAGDTSTPNSTSEPRAALLIIGVFVICDTEVQIQAVADRMRTGSRADDAAAAVSEEYKKPEAPNACLPAYIGAFVVSAFEPYEMQADRAVKIAKIGVVVAMDKESKPVPFDPPLEQFTMLPLSGEAM